jgi:hypothetical protein
MFPSQQNYHASMYDVIYKIMTCNHFGVSTVLYLKILLNIPQQHVGLIDYTDHLDVNLTGCGTVTVCIYICNA